MTPFLLRAFLALALLTGTVHLLAQAGSEVPTRGTTFWTGFMQNGFGAQGLRVHVLGAAGTSGTVSMPGTGWSAPFTVSPNGVVVVNVPTNAENSGSGTVQDKGVLVEALDSVNVLISSFQNFTHDLTQILPVSSLGSSYRVDAYQGLPNFNNLHKSELLIVATEDGTQVEITPSVPTADGQPAGTPYTVDLNAGQTYQVQAAQDDLDLTGTTVLATAQSGNCRPFVVMGGSMCATVPGSCSACDAIFAQLLPTERWGMRYFTIPVQGVGTTTFRILADQDATTVTIGAGAPIILNAGQWHEVNGNAQPVCIQADKPISVVQLLEGYSCAGNGDPSLILLSASDRTSTDVLLHTPTSGQLSQHSISVVVPPSAVGQLALNGTPVAANLFQPYAGCNDRLHARFPVGAGVHRLQAATGFQAYLVGIGFGESYASGIHNIAAPPVPSDSVVCASGEVTLSTLEPMTDIQWTAASDPATVLGTGNSLTLTPLASDSYTVTGNTAASGCPTSFTYHVGVALPPTQVSANAGPSASVCQFEAVQLGLQPSPDPAWFTLQWSPASTLNDPTIADPVATPQEDTWYTVTVTSPSGCGSWTDSVLVEVAPAQVLELKVFTQRPELCAGESTLLTSRTLRVIGQDRFETGGNALWNAIQGGTLSASCGSVSGTALYFNGSGQRYAQTTGLDTQGGGRVRFHLKIADGVAPCQDADPGEDVVLEYSTNNGFSWALVQTFAESAFPTFTPLDLAIPASAEGPNTMFRLRQLGNSGAGHDNWAVDELIVARYDDSWLSYSWSPAIVDAPSAPNTAVSPSSTGWFVLSGTDPSAGCIYSDSVHIEVHPAFSLTVTPDTTLCNAAGLPLNAIPSYPTSVQYQWGPNDGSLSATDVQSPMATPQQTTTYSVEATSAAGCTASGSVTVQVGQLLGLSVSAGSTTLCQGQSTTLQATATGGGTLQYAWTGAGLSDPTSPGPIASPSQTTTYTVTVTDPVAGCQLSEDITLTVSTGYTADAGPDLVLCSALGHQLAVQHNVPGATVAWSPAANLNNASIASPSILTDTSATYTVTVSDANGCSVSDSLTITRPFEDLPSTLTASGCADAPPTLTAPASGESYLWSTGATTGSIVPGGSGAHTVTITDPNGCQGITTFQVTLHALPQIDLGPDVSLCGADSHPINANSPGNSIVWSTGASGQQITVTSGGLYTATATGPQGCTASSSVQVAFLDLPVNTLQDVIACGDAPPTLDAGDAGNTYVWNTGATTSTITASTSGVYSVTVTTADGCSDTFSATVEISAPLALELGNDTSICAGTTLVLGTGNASGNAVWSTGSTAANITVEEAGTYSVTVTNGACTATDTITIGLLDAPVQMLEDATSCADDPVTLDAGNTGSTFLWNTGSTEQSVTVTTPGTYTVTVTAPSGCTADHVAQVQFVAPPQVDLGADTVLCEGQVLQLDAGNPGSSYLWNTGRTNRRLNVDASGTYSVSVSNSHCTRSGSISVYFNPSPYRMAQRQVFTCLDEAPGQTLLDAGNPDADFLWSTGATEQVIPAERYGWHAVDITNAFGCSVRDSVLVSEYCTSAIYVPNSFTPNGDGLNDIFIPVGSNIASMQLLIFDRWGTLLFESNDPAMGWDGMYRNEHVKNDMYMWRLVYRFLEDEYGRLGMEQELMGHVQVLR